MRENKATDSVGAHTDNDEHGVLEVNTKVLASPDPVQNGRLYRPLSQDACAESRQDDFAGGELQK